MNEKIWQEGAIAIKEGDKNSSVWRP